MLKKSFKIIGLPTLLLKGIYMKNSINRQEYPFLDQILWDTIKQVFTPEEVFYFCEKRYQYFNNQELSKKETSLLTDLINTIGNGVFLHA